MIEIAIFIIGAIALALAIILIYCAGHAAGVGEGFEKGVSRGHELALEAVDNGKECCDAK